VLRHYDDLARSQTIHENRIYSLKIKCGDGYPNESPEVQFESRVNLPFVNQLDGRVDSTKLPVLQNWNKSKSLETVLVEIRKCVVFLSLKIKFFSYVYIPRREMASFNNRKLPQPPEGSVFPEEHRIA